MTIKNVLNIIQFWLRKVVFVEVFKNINVKIVIDSFGVAGEINYQSKLIMIMFLGNKLMFN